MINDRSHVDKAAAYYSKGFNCSQSVFTAYAAEWGIEEELALKLGTNFGSGARKGELCGAVSGALMVLGLKCGHCDSRDMEAEAKAYAVSEEYMNRFMKANGSVVCRDILGCDLTKPDDRAQIKEKDLFHTICPEMVRSAVTILEEMSSEGIC